MNFNDILNYSLYIIPLVLVGMLFTGNTNELMGIKLICPKSSAGLLTFGYSLMLIGYVRR